MKVRHPLLFALACSGAAYSEGIKDYEVRPAAHCLSASFPLSMEVTCLHSALKANCTPDNWQSKCEMYADLEQKGRSALDNVRNERMSEEDAKRQLVEAVEKRAGQFQPTNYAAPTAERLSSPHPEQANSAPRASPGDPDIGSTVERVQAIQKRAAQLTYDATSSSLSAYLNDSALVLVEIDSIDARLSRLAGTSEGRALASTERETLDQLKSAQLNHVTRSVAAWRNSPHDAPAVLEIISQAAHLGILRLNPNAMLTVKCAVAEQARCAATGYDALGFLGSPLTGSNAPSTADYQLLIVPGEIRRTTAIDNETQVTSTFRSGTREVPNPRYFALQNQYQAAALRLQSAHQEYSQASQMPPSLASGWAEGTALGHIRQINDLLRKISAELQLTSPSMSEEVTIPYTYSLLSIRARYEQPIGYMLIHRRSGSAWASKGLVEDDKEFKIAKGVHAADTQHTDYLTDKIAVDRWLEQKRDLGRSEFTRLNWSRVSAAVVGTAKDQSYAAIATKFFVGALRSDDLHSRRKRSDDPSER